MEIEKWKTQCRYLQNELDSMKQQLSDAKDLIRLNKEQLKICYNPQSFDQSSECKAALVLLKYVQEENEVLLKKIDQLSDERNLAFDKAFISDQINESNQRMESSLITSLNKTITELKKKLNEQVQMSNEMMGTIYLEKHLTQPDQLTLNFNNVIQQMNSMLLKQKLQMEELVEQKNDLAQLNFSLSNEILKIRTQRFTPRNQTKTFFSQHEDPSKFINNLVQLQKRLFFDDDSQDEKMHMQQSAVFSPLFSPSLPQKVKRQQKQQIPKDFKQEPEKYIPKLDLTKAQQIQQFNIKRMQLLANKLANEGVEQKIFMLQDELLRTKNKYHAQLVLNQQLDLQLTELNLQIMELQNVNETLIKSNQIYEEKWSSIFQQFSFYKEFYLKHKDQIQHNLQSYATSDDQQQFSVFEFEKALNSSKIYKKNTTQKNPSNNNPALSIINYQDDTIQQSSYRLPTDRQEEANKFLTQQYKCCLMMMAKEVISLDCQHVKPVQTEHNKVKIKRSYSNTIEYFPVF
ncbi:unnamed protein product (macronuclear) [Paramecium tetraurelia]|uniref:Uncharacterized protein n=1 Tax=Paramecium tetraurelia TaxID=5888 RepID=A0CJC9_PARTE|nr:uncharacterized protein GSPATT00000607001 [Paramecium tetraurelia]CAK70896.1 unnamed protein product [Paramecium tetraurelia]|eukprot:XP_001438293.1 hypothetical protein (macronuclear) [Paramecium tetraurelia strain d4-2]